MLKNVTSQLFESFEFLLNSEKKLSPFLHVKLSDIHTFNFDIMEYSTKCTNMPYGLLEKTL